MNLLKKRNGTHLLSLIFNLAWELPLKALPLGVWHSWYPQIE